MKCKTPGTAPYLYRLLGLVVGSDLRLPELAEASRDAVPDIRIRCDTLPSPGRSAPANIEQPYRVDGDAFFLEKNGVARFRVVEGRDLTVDICHGADPVDVRVFCLGSVFGALCHQRDLLPLHAAAVAEGGKALAYAGPSGTGKSTLAAGLCQHGFEFVNDDICPLELRENSQPRVLGSIRRSKLPVDALRALGRDPRGGIRDHRLVPKLHLPVDEAVPEAASLRGVYMFRRDQGIPRRVRFERIRPAWAVRCFESLTYMPAYPRLAGRAEEHFLHCAALASQVPLFLVHHAPGLDSLPFLLRELAEHGRSLLETPPASGDRRAPGKRSEVR